MVWHGHELSFGCTLAVVTAFLFTAIHTWIGKRTPTGVTLAAFALRWIAGRVLVMTPYAVAAAWVNAAFPMKVATAVAIPVARSSNSLNYFFVPLLLLPSLAVLSLHTSYLGVFAWPPQASLQFGLDVVLFIMAVIGGRVIPMFTNNGVPDTQAKRNPPVEKLALGGILSFLGADFLQAPPAAIAVLALAVAAAHAARLYHWQPWRTFRTPLVWILHAAYGWMVIYRLLRALAAIGLVSAPLAFHALTIGAIGTMTMGMMTRIARDHTGRAHTTGGFELTHFVLVQMAALGRVPGASFSGRLSGDGHHLRHLLVRCCRGRASTANQVRRGFFGRRHGYASCAVGRMDWHSSGRTRLANCNHQGTFRI